MSQGRAARHKGDWRHGDEAQRSPSRVWLPSNGRAGEPLSRVQLGQQLEKPQATLHSMQLTGNNHAAKKVRGEESIKWDWEVPWDWHLVQWRTARQGSHAEVCVRDEMEIQGSPAATSVQAETFRHLSDNHKKQNSHKVFVSSRKRFLIAQFLHQFFWLS